MRVAIARATRGKDPVSSAVELCGGLDGIGSGTRVLVKPNLVLGGNQRNFPPYGAVTTARVVEQIIRLLIERGARDITIGDGSAVSLDLGSSTRKAFSFSGIRRVARQHGVRLVDFNNGRFTPIELEGESALVSSEVTEADFIIDVPVLKTHLGTRVSLGMKNLKGCLRMADKKMCHRRGLDVSIASLAGALKPDLTVIDGTYAMEHGPAFGLAHRANLVIASREVLAADMAGAAVMGIDPSSVDHLIEYANRHGIEMDASSIQVVGDAIADVALELDYRWDPHLYFKKFGVEGIRVVYPEPPKSVCSLCYGIMEMSHLMFAKDNGGVVMDDLEVRIGRVQCKPRANRLLLFGDCAVKTGPAAIDSIEVGGCPPRLPSYLWTLTRQTIGTRKALSRLARRTARGAGYMMGLYFEDFGFLEPYGSEEFDPSDFR